MYVVATDFFVHPHLYQGGILCTLITQKYTKYYNNLLDSLHSVILIISIILKLYCKCLKEMEEGKIMIAVLRDFKRAFETVKRELLTIQKLESIG